MLSDIAIKNQKTEREREREREIELGASGLLL
jgi:hypothetical protein